MHVPGNVVHSCRCRLFLYKADPYNVQYTPSIQDMLIGHDQVGCLHFRGGCVP